MNKLMEDFQDEIEDIDLIDEEEVDAVASSGELYEHFRVVVDKGQTPIRVDKYLFERIVNAHATAFKMLLRQDA